jgi:hypothetical protein
MTATMKIRRDKVTDKYRREIEVRYEVRVRVL